MSNIFKALLIGAYSALFLHTIRILIIELYYEPDIELNYIFREKKLMRRLQEEMMFFGDGPKEMTIDFKPPKKFPTDLKYILKYSQISWNFNTGQKPFIENKCKFNNCYLTSDRTLLNDLRNFDAIIFTSNDAWDRLPVRRSHHQRYIFIDSESDSVEAGPICNPYFDSYFNWTWSYKTGADIRWFSKYKIIEINSSAVVGPKENMNWISMDKTPPYDVQGTLKKKANIAVWFRSNCTKRTEAYRLTMEIQKYLHLHSHGKYKVDIFGPCGTNLCPSWRMEDCFDFLEDIYRFYFAFEDSKYMNYVSDKILHAVQHFTVPVVFRGADYTRYLPPGSYIDATKHSAETVAIKMIEAATNKEKYSDYFRWHNYYSYEKPDKVFDICSLCQLLHERRGRSAVRHFRKWWNPDYEIICNGRLNYSTEGYGQSAYMDTLPNFQKF